MKKGLFLIVLAGVMWGTSCVFVNIFAPYGFSSGQMTAMRLGLAFVGLFLYCLLFNRKALKVQLRDLPLFVICGITLYGTAAFYYEAMQHTTVATAVMLMYISPVPIMLISVLCLGEKFNAKKGIAVVLMLVGCAFVAGVIGNFKPSARGVTMGLLSAAAYTIYNVFCKIEARRKINPFSSMLYTFLFASVCALIVCKPWELPSLIAQKPLLLAPMFLLHSMVTGLLPYLIYSISLKHLPVGIASSMSIIEPMTGALLGFLVYQDPLTPTTFVGIVLIVGSVFLLGISESNGKKVMNIQK